MAFYSWWMLTSVNTDDGRSGQLQLYSEQSHNTIGLLQHDKSRLILSRYSETCNNCTKFCVQMQNAKCQMCSWDTLERGWGLGGGIMIGECHQGAKRICIFCPQFTDSKRQERANLHRADGPTSVFVCSISADSWCRETWLLIAGNTNAQIGCASLNKVMICLI